MTHYDDLDELLGRVADEQPDLADQIGPTTQARVARELTAAEQMELLVAAVGDMEWDATCAVMGLPVDAEDVPSPTSEQREQIVARIADAIRSNPKVAPTAALADALEAENLHEACAAVDLLVAEGAR